MQALLDWMSEPTTLTVLTASSIVLVGLGILGIPWFVSRIPEDYLVEEKEADDASWGSGGQIALRVGKNFLGVLLLIVGVFMLILPGQGLLAMLVALFLIDFPGKQRLRRKLIRKPRILRTINAIRKRTGKPPLKEPE